jgi:large subunit ribosomal protein L25
MADTALLSASPRTASGKGGARSLRRAGKIPAVIYGRGREPEPLELDGGAIERLLAKIRAATTLLDVTVADRPAVKALIREIQRDPIRPTSILHMDLYEVHADEKISVEVPVHFVGVPDGVRNGGGVFEVITHDLEIWVLPADIPERIDVDVTNLAVGHSIHVSEVQLANAEILTDGAVTLCTVVTPKLEVEPVVAAETEVDAAAEPELIRKTKADEDEEADED